MDFQLFCKSFQSSHMEFQGGSDIWVVQTVVTSIYDIITYEKILGRKVMRLTLWEDKLPIWNMPNGSLRFAIADLISFAYRKNHKILYIWGWFICCIMLLPYGFHKIFDKLYHRKCYWCLVNQFTVQLSSWVLWDLDWVDHTSGEKQCSPLILDLLFTTWECTALNICFYRQTTIVAYAHQKEGSFFTSVTKITHQDDGISLFISFSYMT